MEEIADSDSSRPWYYIFVYLGNGFQNPEVECVIDMVHYPIHWFQWVRYLNHLFDKFIFQQVKIVIGKWSGRFV